MILFQLLNAFSFLSMKSKIKSDSEEKLIDKKYTRRSSKRKHT